MSNQSKSRKSLWIGILAAVVVLTTVLCLVMAGCNNEQAATPTTTAPAATGGEASAAEVDLYWNVDRALYDGMSEAGMSSREPAEDGYFHVRFFKDGEIVELRVADRKTINAMEIQSLMGLEFDENGIVVGIAGVDELPVEKLAWQFYVQSAGGKLIKTNSSASLNGMEILLELSENTGVWDMTGLSGEVGCEATPMQLDRVFAVGNEDGEVSHIFIYERPNYMKTHEGECEHCKKTVTWYEWTKESSLPINTGHYQLMNDLTNVTQASMVEDAKICVDLNGHRIDGKSGARIYSLHNAGTELAIMDTSEAKTGRIAAHGQGDQGMCIWLRYGVLYLYDGIIDGSDATTYLNGPTINMANNTYFYMYGGELIGGTADTKSNGKGGWTGGVGGTLFIGANSKFVMNDGIIHGGYAKAKITKYDANGKPTAYSCGSGGNIFANTGAVIEMNGGTIRDGRAAIYGNIYLGSKAEMTLNAGLIAGGSLYIPSANGGNIGINGTANFIMNGGTIRNGRSYNCGGNIYLNGRFQMNDGIITDGKILKWGTKEVNDASGSRNVFSVNGDFYMYGGRVAGGFEAIDTDAKTNPTVVLVSARSVIFDEDGTGPHLRLTNTSTGGLCDLYVGQMHDEGKVGISAVQKALFTKPTDEKNADNFVSDIPEAEIIWTSEGIAIGKSACVCGSTTDKHIGDCDGTQHIWAGVSSLPTTTGYFYLTKDITTGQAGIVSTEHQEVYLNLNGKTVTASSRAYLMQQQNLLGITDHVGGGKILMGGSNNNNCGGILMQGNSHIKMYGGTLAMKERANQTSTLGGIVEVQGVFDMYGGTIEGGYANQAGNVWVSNTGIFNLYDGTVKNGVATKYNGGNFNVQAKGVLNVYGGLITDGYSPDSGGNIVCYGELNISGGTIMNGYAGKGNGYNISVVSSGDGQLRTLNLTGGTIAGGLHFNNYKAPYTNVNISGNPVIDSSLATANTPSYPLLISRAKMINIGTLTEGAEIHVSGASGLFTNPTAQGNEKYFVSDIENGTVQWSANGLLHGELGACVCGGKAEGMEGHTCEPALWSPWTSTTSLPTSAGNYYLTADIVRNDQTVVYGQDVAIDLRGHNITFNVPVRSDGYRFLRVQRATDANGAAYGPGANVSFTDSTSNPGTVKVVIPDYSGASADVQTKMQEGNQGMLFWMWDQSSITIYDGVFDGTQIAATKRDGATIDVGGGATLNLYGGTIKPGKISWSSNIRVSGTMNVYGGTITGGKANNGGNIGVYGTLNVKGGTISKGTATGNGGNICVNSGATLNMSGGIVSGGNAVTGGNIMGAGAVNITGGTVENGVSTSAGGNICAWGSKLNISNATISGGNGVHGGNICTDGSIKMTISNATIKNGVSSNSGGNILMWGSSTLDMTNSTLSGGQAKNGGNLSVGSNNVATLTGCTVSGGSSVVVGGNIACYKVMTLNNCTVTGGSAKSNSTDYCKGGNIYIHGASADVKINGGLIEKGTIDSGTKYWAPGGNICVEGGAKLTVDGGARITGGNPLSRDADGNNIYMTSDNTVITLKNCTVENTRDGGGNINLERGTLNIEGASIINSAYSSSNIRTNGAGKKVTINLKSGTISGGTNANISLNADDTLNISGGTITGGRSGDDGGNIYMWGGSALNMTGGTVTKGIATANGGNIFVASGATATITGGTISSGRAKQAGNMRANGTLNYGGTAVMEYGGSQQYGGNLFSPNGSTVNMTGGIIRNGGQATLTDGVWSSDSAMNKGWTEGNVLNEGKFIMTGGQIVGTYTCWSQSKLTMSGDATIYVKGNGLNLGSTAMTLGKMNIGDTPKVTIFTNKTNAPTPKKIATLASDVTYTEEELNKLFLGWAWDDTSIQFTFYLNGNEVWMKQAN